MTERFSKEYLDYIHSQEWRDRREIALAKAHYKCQYCGTSNNLECHHTSYAHLGHERDNELTVLCHKCHNNIHKNTYRGGFKKKPKLSLWDKIMGRKKV